MHFKNLSQKIAKMSALTVAGIIAGVMFTPTDTFGALPKKKLEIIIGGENFCKDDKDCAGDSFCNMTSHICISCSAPFEWVGGTQCVCPSGTVPNADNTSCVECMSDENCQVLKGNLHWVCDTDANTCECLSGLHEESGQCVCDNANKTPNEDGNCICQINQTSCPNSDFTGDNNCNCCPTGSPKWDGLECKTCAETNNTTLYYDLATHKCVECLNNEHCGSGAYCETTSNICVCSGIKEYRQDVGETEPTCQCPLDTPVEADPDTCECPVNMDMIYEKIDGKTVKKCVVSCPSNTGITGLRDRENNICQCDTSLGFKPDAEGEMCVCDESRNYYNDGKGGCTKCFQTTKEFCENSTQKIYDCNSEDSTVWFCGVYKIANNGIPQIYNPSTKTYCGQWEVLRKDANEKFYCTMCDGSSNLGQHNNYTYASRATGWGYCLCFAGRKMDPATGLCIRPCGVGSYYYEKTGQCSLCDYNSIPTPDGKCLNISNSLGQYCWTSDYSNLSNGYMQYTYEFWYNNVNDECRKTIYPNLDPNHPCSYKKGCFFVQSQLPYCSINGQITSDCRCPTATANNRYCCASPSYETANGCVTCTGGSVPNANKDGCEVCKDNTIAKDGKCIPCETGYYPNVSHTRCLACPNGTTTDEKGLGCVVIANKDIG